MTTLTKRMAENLSEYFAEVGVKVNYLHSEILTLERIKISAIFGAVNSTYWSGSTFFAKG